MQPPPGQPNYFAPPQPPRSNAPIWIAIAVGCVGCSFVGILLLAALLFPVFSQAREKARAISCLSNNKQMALGVLIYAQDYDEVYPRGKQWMSSIDPYVRNPRIFHCPSVPHSGAALTNYGYAYNAEISGKSIAVIADPRRTRMTYDSSDLARNATDLGASIDPRHQRHAMISFVDGHAELVEPPFKSHFK